MAGLLGLDDDMRLALLTAGLGTLAGRGGPMRAAGQGGLMGVASYQNSKSEKSQAERERLRDEMLRMQLEQAREQMAMARAARAQQEAAQAGISSAFQQSMTPGSPGRPAGLGDVDSGMDTGMQPAEAPRAPAFDYGRFAQGVAPFDQKLALDALGKAGPKEKKVKEQRPAMLNGKPVMAILYEDGTHEYAPYEPEADMQMVGLNDRTVAVDKRRLQPGTEFKLGTSPDTVYSGNITMRGQNMTDARAREMAAAAKAAGGADGGKITESQGTAAVYLSMMGEANKTLEKLGGKDAPYAASVQIAKSPTMGWAASGTGKQVAAAQMQWVEAALRITTGATAPPEEIVRMTRMYFPQVNDDPQTVKQKNAARAAFESGVRIKAGAGGPAADRGVAAIGGGDGGLTPAEQAELDALKKRFGR